MIGELLEHREPRFLLTVEIAAFEVDHFGRFVLPIDEGALQREIDIAGDQVAVPDRNLAQHQRDARGRLQTVEHFANAFVGAIDLVQEQKSGNTEIFEFAQDQLQLRQLALVGFTHHHGGVDGGKRRAHVVREFDGAGTIEEGVALTHELGGDGRQAEAHFVLACLGAGVAVRGARIDRAGPRDGAGSCQDRFK